MEEAENARSPNRTALRKENSGMRKRGTVFQYQQVPQDPSPLQSRCQSNLVEAYDSLLGHDNRTMRDKSAFDIVWHLLKSILYNHGGEIFGIFTSLGLCMALHAVHERDVDSSFFKGVGLLIAVLMSLRVKNAVSRRQKLVASVLRMINSARNVVALSSFSCDERRQMLFHILAYVFAETGMWFTVSAGKVKEKDVVTEEVWDWPREEFQRVPDRYRVTLLRNSGMYELGCSPRPLLLYLRNVVDELVCAEFHTDWDEQGVDRVSALRRWHRNIDLELGSIINQFDNLSTFEEQVHTRQFKWMISGLAFMYVTFYPWQVSHESRYVLALTTVFMSVVFYGLNQITCELEDPLDVHGQSFNLLLTFHKAFKSIESEMAMRDRCAAALTSASTNEENPLGDPPTAVELLARREAFIEAELRRDDELQTRPSIVLMQ